MANILQKLHLTPGTGVGAMIKNKVAPKGSAVRRFLTGNDEQFKQIPNQTPQGQELLSHLMQQGKQNTDFGGIENETMRKFNENIVPSIAARFGSQNQDSSGYRGALGNASANLGSQLGALRSQYGLQQSQLGLTPQFDTYHQPEDFGFLGKLAPMLAKAAIAYGTGGLSEGGSFLGSGRQSPLDKLFGLNQPQPQQTRPNSGYGQDFPQWQALEQMKQQSNPENATYKDFFDKYKQAIPEGYATPNYKKGAYSPINQPMFMQGPQPQLNQGYDTGRSFSDLYPEYDWMTKGISNMGGDIIGAGRKTKRGIDKFWNMLPNSYV